METSFNYTVERVLLAHRHVGQEITVNEQYPGILREANSQGLSVETFVGIITFKPIEVRSIRIVTQ